MLTRLIAEGSIVHLIDADKKMLDVEGHYSEVLKNVLVHGGFVGEHQAFIRFIC